MIKIMFVCHGNICRSPMAEFVMKDILKKEHLENRVYVASSATSTEEIGNPVHYGTRNRLASEGISTEGKYAVQFTSEDYAEYDYIIAMDSANVRNIMRIIGSDELHKVKRLLEFAGVYRDVRDPWYTGDFDETFNDVTLGLNALTDEIKNRL